MKLKNLLKIVISFLLLFYLIYKLQPSKIISVFKEVNYFYFLFLILIIPLMQFIKVLKWNLFLKKMNLHYNKKRLLKITLYGSLLGMITPGRVGELYKIKFLKDEKSKTLPTVLGDKIIDIFNLLFLAIIVSPFFLKSSYFYPLLIGISFFLIFIVFIITNKSFINLISKLLNINLKNQENYLNNILSIMKDKKLLISTFLFATLYHSLNMVLYFIVLKSIDSSLPWILSLSLPILTIFGNLPITLSGLGLREGIAVLIFRNFGLDPSTGFTFSLLVFSVVSLGTIPTLISLYLHKIIKRNINKKQL